MPFAHNCRCSATRTHQCVKAEYPLIALSMVAKSVLPEGRTVESKFFATYSTAARKSSGSTSGVNGVSWDTRDSHSGIRRDGCRGGTRWEKREIGRLTEALEVGRREALDGGRTDMLDGGRADKLEGDLNGAL